jgi:hypothetical protein
MEDPALMTVNLATVRPDYLAVARREEVDPETPFFWSLLGERATKPRRAPAPKRPATKATTARPKARPKSVTASA